MSKKLYRSLSYNNDVYEVEELVDNPAESTENITILMVTKDIMQLILFKDYLIDFNSVYRRGLI